MLMPMLGYFWRECALGFPRVFPSLDDSHVMLQLVILMESAVPTAQNVIMLLLVQGQIAQGQAMAIVILYQYAWAVLSFTAASAFFMCILLG